MDKLARKFDAVSTGRMLLCCILVGMLAGTGAAVFRLGLDVCDTQVVLLYDAAGIRFPESSLDEYKISQRHHDSSSDTDPSVNGFGSVSGSRHSDKLMRWDETRCEQIFGFITVPKYWILLLLVPAFAGLVVGIVIQAIAPEAEANSLDLILKTFHMRSGMLRVRAAVVRAGTGLLTIGSGGSGGLEGGVMLFGSGIGQWISRITKTNAAQRRLLVLAGAAGGLSAILHVPVGAAVLVSEILYCSIAVEVSVMIPCLITSIVSYHTYRLLGMSPIYQFSEVPREVLKIGGPVETLVFVVLAVLLAVICTVIGLGFVEFIQWLKKRGLPFFSAPEFLKPALGGLMVGVIILFYPQVRGTGTQWFPLFVWSDSFPWLFLVGFAVAKLMATACTVSSGGSGSYIVPVLLAGGALGGAFGQVTVLLLTFFGLESVAPHPALMAAVGMATLFGGVASVPLAAAIIVCEMTGGAYNLSLPLLCTALIHFAIRSPRKRLYDEQVLTPRDSPAHLGDYSMELLDSIPIQETLTEHYQLSTSTPSSTFLSRSSPSVIVSEDTSLSVLFQQLTSSTTAVLAVVDDSRRFVGFVTAEDVRAAFQNHGIQKHLTAADLMQRMETRLFPQNTLLDALQLCVLHGVESLPILESPQCPVVVAMLQKTDITTTYHRHLAAVQLTDEENEE